MEDVKKCKAINVFFPVLIVVFVGLSMLLSVFVFNRGIQLPVWSQYVLSQAFILVPALLYVIIFKENYPREISYRGLRPVDALLSLLTGYALIPMVLLIGNVTMLFSTNFLQESSVLLTEYPFIAQILIMAVLPPIVEEFVFRGLFFHTYRKIGVVGGAIVSGLIFGLFHLNINQFCYAFVMGIIFAFMVEATGSMWASMIAHFAVNTYSIGVLKLVSLLSDSSTEILEEASSTSLADLPPAAIAAELMFLAVLAAGFLVLAVIMIRKMASRNGRLENIRIRGTHNNIKSYFSWPVIVTMVVCVIYMVYIEL